jgi:hypothetical protein
MDHNVSGTQGTGMLGCIVLVDAFKPERLAWAAIAIEYLLLERLRKWFDLGLKDPLHVLQCQFLRVRAFWRINHWLFAGSLCCCRLLGHLGIESLADVNEGFGSKPAAVFLVDLVTVVPLITDDFISVTDNLSTKGSLNLLPVLINRILGCFGACQSRFKVAGQVRDVIILDWSRHSSHRLWCLSNSFLSGSPLSEKTRLENIPCFFVQWYCDLDCSFEGIHMLKNVWWERWIKKGCPAFYLELPVGFQGFHFRKSPPLTD